VQELREADYLAAAGTIHEHRQHAVDGARRRRRANVKTLKVITAARHSVKSAARFRQANFTVT
jgi:hypothetical protein